MCGQIIVFEDTDGMEEKEEEVRVQIQKEFHLFQGKLRLYGVGRCYSRGSNVKNCTCLQS